MLSHCGTVLEEQNILYVTHRFLTTKYPIMAPALFLSHCPLLQPFMSLGTLTVLRI